VLLYLASESPTTDKLTVWENVYLISARSRSEALRRAEELGKSEQEADVDSGHTADGIAVRWVYAGVRKLSECISADGEPRDGDEVTYLEYVVQDESVIDALLRNEPATVVIGAVAS
jgi:hypothetical protein